MAHRGNSSIALPFHDHGTRRGWGVSVMPHLLFTPRKDLVPIVQEAGWAPGPVWTGAENLAPTKIQSPDRPARRESLYWLSYPAHITLLLLTLPCSVPSLLLCRMNEKFNLNVPAFLEMHVYVEPIKKSLIPSKPNILQLNDKDLILCLVIYVSG